MARLDPGAAATAGMANSQPNADGLFDLGIKAATGRSGQPDLVAAHKWFNLAAARGNVSAKTYRVELSQEMTTDQISEAQKQAREWLQTH